jgi:hypothetical protein
MSSNPKKLTLELDEDQAEYLTSNLREQLSTFLDCASDGLDEGNFEMAGSYIYDAQRTLEMEGILRQAKFRAAYEAAAAAQAAKSATAEPEISALQQPAAKA